MDLRHAAKLINEHVTIVLASLEHVHHNVLSDPADKDTSEALADMKESAHKLGELARGISEEVFGISRVRKLRKLSKQP